MWRLNTDGIYDEVRVPIWKYINMHFCVRTTKKQEDFRLIHRQIITKPKFHDCSFWVEMSAVGLEKRAKAFQKQSCPQINLAFIGCTNLFASLHDLLSYQSRLAQLLQHATQTRAINRVTSR